MDDWYESDGALDDYIRRARADPDAQPVVSGYGQIQLVSRGGQALVYTAIRTSDGQRVALKLLRVDALLRYPQAEKRLLREARRVLGLDHPHIVQARELTQDDLGRPVLVLEWMPGGSLTAHLPFGEPGSLLPDLRAAVRLLVTLCEATSVAHRSGLIHRDIKPSNVLLDGTGSAKLSDFGLALRPTPESERLTRSGVILASLAYAPPEALARRHGQPALPELDVYGLGGVLYQMLTGEPPHRLEGGKRRAVVPPPGALVPRRWDARLEGILRKALAWRAAARYATPGELGGDLEAWLDGRPTRARPVRAPARLWQRLRSRWGGRRGLEAEAWLSAQTLRVED